MTVDSSAVNNTENEDGGSTLLKRVSSFFRSLVEWRNYPSFAIFLVAFTLILGIISLSFLHPKKEPLLFGLVILSILLALGTFTALCFFVQRAKDQKYGDNPYDPNHIDILCTLGIAGLFGLSALAQLIRLPQRCYSEHDPNDPVKAAGAAECGILTTMGVFSCLGSLIMLITCILVGVAIRQAIEVAKLPPPVFPSGATPAVMRWLDRNDPFNVSSRDPQRQNSYGA